MQINKERLQSLLCSAFCANVNLHPIGDDYFFIETPFTFSDGDVFSIYIKEAAGGFRLTDLGHTFMQMSYLNDVSIFRTGTRGRLLEQIFVEFGISEKSGEVFIETSPDELTINLFRLGQAITRITVLITNSH